MYFIPVLSDYNAQRNGKLQCARQIACRSQESIRFRGDFPRDARYTGDCAKLLARSEPAYRKAGEAVHRCHSLVCCLRPWKISTKPSLHCLTRGFQSHVLRALRADPVIRRMEYQETLRSALAERAPADSKPLWASVPKHMALKAVLEIYPDRCGKIPCSLFSNEFIIKS